ncbi:MAG TPA: hypothetical protein VLA54_05890 [Acidimicrobiia bacterium]|nr:hypothetical protein [Acidimicrobiia bacterium]
MTINATQHDRLLTIVLDCLGDQGAEVLEGGWAVRTGSGGVLGLVNLAQELAGIPDEEWPEIIRSRVTSLVGVDRDLPADYAAAGPRLRVRLSADGSVPGWAAFRRVCDGLDETLMMRNEVGCITVPPAQSEVWGVSLDRMWEDARQQTTWDEPRERRILAKGDMRMVWVRANFFASSVLLDLAHLLSPGNRFGALAMVPCRDALLYTEVVDERVALATAGMIEIGSQWYVDGPGSISPEVFWYRPDRTITRVVRVEGTEFITCWDAEFSRVLAQIEREQNERNQIERRGASPMKRRKRTTP